MQGSRTEEDGIAEDNFTSLQVQEESYKYQPNSFRCKIDN